MLEKGDLELGYRGYVHGIDLARVALCRNNSCALSSIDMYIHVCLDTRLYSLGPNPASISTLFRLSSEVINDSDVSIIATTTIPAVCKCLGQR